MRILLVAPKFVRKAGEYYIFPLGLALISAVLKQAGHDVRCLNLNHVDGTIEDALRPVFDEFDPEMMGTGALSVHYPQAKALLAAARAIKPDIVNVLGNGLVSSAPELILTNTEADIGVIGEGEETILELVAALEDGTDLGVVPGLAFLMEDGTFMQTLPRASNKDLDSLPWPDYDGFEMAFHLDIQKCTDHHFLNLADRPRAAELISSRSCPFKCTFCYHPIGRVYRERSLDSVFAELDYMVAHFGVTMVSLMDELFAVKRERLVDFCERIKGYGLKWMVQLRVDIVDEEILAMMRDAGCTYISLGLESMSPAVLDSMQKKVTREQIETALAMVRSAGIGIQGNFIFGDPAETLETANETLDWWARHRNYQAFLIPIQCYPGTYIYHQAVERGLIEDALTFHEKECPPINATSMDDESYGRLLGRIGLFNSTILYPGELIAMEKQPERDPFRGALYALESRCPDCGGVNAYRDVPVDRAPFGRTTFRLTCRHCCQRYDLPISLVPQGITPEVENECRRAETLLRSGDVKGAHRAYLAALRHAPYHLPAVAGASTILLQAGLVAEAIKVWESAVLTDPVNPAFHVMLADLLRAVGEEAAASLHYRQALTLRPDDAMARAKLATVDAAQAARPDAPVYIAAE